MTKTFFKKFQKHQRITQKSIELHRAKNEEKKEISQKGFDSSVWNHVSPKAVDWLQKKQVGG